eukprot:jgi/Picsp_1/4573/NSC_01943-R1_restriction endonuclease
MTLAVQEKILQATRSRSGREVKPKVYNDGMISSMSLGRIEYDTQEYMESKNSRKRTRVDNSKAEQAGLDQAPPAKCNGGIFKAAAIEVLRQEMRLMTTGEITKLALMRNLIKCSGKTPDATMASALYTDVKKREHNSAFVRPKEGLFGLREWAKGGTMVPSIEFKVMSAAENVIQSQEEAAQEPGHIEKQFLNEGMHLEQQPCSLAASFATSGNNRKLKVSNYRRDGLIDLLSAAEHIGTPPTKAVKVDAFELTGSCNSAREEEFSRLVKGDQSEEKESNFEKKDDSPSQHFDALSVGRERECHLINACSTELNNNNALGDGGEPCVQSPERKRPLCAWMINLESNLRFLKSFVAAPSTESKQKAEDALSEVENSIKTFLSASNGSPYDDGLNQAKIHLGQTSKPSEGYELLPPVLSLEILPLKTA